MIMSWPLTAVQAGVPIACSAFLQGQLLRAQLPGTIAMFCARNAWTVLEALKDAADASYLLAREGLGSISQDMAVSLRPLIDHVRPGPRRSTFPLP